MNNKMKMGIPLLGIVVAIAVSGCIGSLLGGSNVFTSASWTDANTLILSGPTSPSAWNQPMLSSPREATEVMHTDFSCSSAFRESSVLNFWVGIFKSWGVTGTENILNWLVINKQCGFHLNKDTIGLANYNILKQHGTATDYTQYVSADKQWNWRCICQLCGVPYPCDDVPCYADWNCFQWVYTGEYHTFLWSHNAAEVNTYINNKVECYLDYGSKYYGTPEIFDNDQLVCRIALPSGGIQMPASAKVVFRFNVDSPIKTNEGTIRSDMGYCGDAQCQSDSETSQTCAHDCVYVPPVVPPVPEPCGYYWVASASECIYTNICPPQGTVTYPDQMSCLQSIIVEPPVEPPITPPAETNFIAELFRGLMNFFRMLFGQPPI